MWLHRVKWKIPLRNLCKTFDLTTIFGNSTSLREKDITLEKPDTYMTRSGKA